MDRFEDLQTFVTVVETGSFTAAADRLDVAKSAVSRRLSALEGRLGVQLIRRTTRRLNLTETGQSFHVHCVRILADLEEAESAVTQEHGELRGRLRVALPLSFGLHHMCKPIARFSRRHPGVDFDLDLNDRKVDLLEEGIDVAVRIGRLKDSTLIARKIFESRTVVCGGRQYLQERGTPHTPDDLRQHSCLAYSNLAEPDRWTYFGEDGGKTAVVIKPVMSVNSGEFLCAAAGLNLGLIMLPTFIAHEAIRRGDLVPVLTDWHWPVTPAYAIYPQTRHLSYRVRAFIDFLVEYFSGTSSWDRDCHEVTAANSPP